MEDNLCTIYKLKFNKLNQFLIKNNINIVEDPEDSDLIVIGCCAAFEADEKRAFDMIHKLEKFNKPINLYGCLSKVRNKETNKYTKFCSWDMEKLAENIVSNPTEPWKSVELPEKFRNISDYRIYNPKKKFIGLTEGCSFKCTYCPHKIGAGDIISRREEEIIEQIKKMNSIDVDTIVLTGIDTASYGKDQNRNFAQLLKKVLEILNKNIKIHIAQFNPEGLKDDFELLVECCQDNRTRDIQLPIQSTSNKLLKIMKRDYDTEIVEKFIKLVREKNDNVIFRTDLMVGFPTETTEELDQSINFVIKNFDEVAVYGFELKKDTEIASYDIEYFDATEIELRRRYAVEKIKLAQIMVHSGGQEISTLVSSDKIKEQRRS